MMARSGYIPITYGKFKYAGKSQCFKHVYKYSVRKNAGDGVYDKVMWGYTIGKSSKRGMKKAISSCPKYETEKAAAKAVDMYLISIGLEPVNILKRV